MIASFMGPVREFRHDGLHPFFGLLTMLLCLGAVAAVLWLVMARRPHHQPPVPPGAPAPHYAGPGAWAASPVSPTANAEAILAERLARGEIPAEEYTSLLATLRGTPPA